MIMSRALGRKRDSGMPGEPTGISDITTYSPQAVSLGLMWLLKTHPSSVFYARLWVSGTAATMLACGIIRAWRKTYIPDLIASTLVGMFVGFLSLQLPLTVLSMDAAPTQDQVNLARIAIALYAYPSLFFLVWTDIKEAKFVPDLREKQRRLAMSLLVVVFTIVFILPTLSLFYH